MKTKIAGALGTIGGLCALCCTLPFFGLLGFGALEAFFCENELLQGMGITLFVGSLIYFVTKFYNRKKVGANSCSISCNCRAS